MLSADLEQQLSDIEQQYAQLALAVEQGDTDALESVSVHLRHSAVELAHTLERAALDAPARQAFALRLQKVAAGVGVQRGGVARRAAAVERALNAVVPATREVTYGKAAGPYGAASRQTGAFKRLAA